MNCQHSWFDIPDTVKKAERQIRKTEKYVFRQANSFFDNFQTIDDAIDILSDENSAIFLFLKSGIGSTNHNNVIETLRTLL